MAPPLTLRHFAAAALLCCPASATVSAQSSPLPPQAAQFLQSTFNRQAIQEAIIRYSKTLPGACAEIRFDTKFNVVIISPLQFSADGRTLTSGVWKEQVPANACGKTRTFNILTIRRADGSLVRSPLFIGTTRTDPQLQHDATPHAIISASGKASAGCKEVRIVDTSFVDFSGPPLFKGAVGRDMRPWDEKWTVQACDAQVVVSMKFVPDDRGTTITATIDAKSR